jgi:hypothetical protein
MQPTQASTGSSSNGAGKWAYLPGGSYADFTAGFSVLAGGRLILDRVPDCGTTKGLYRWKVAGRLLTLTKLRDKCAAEVGLFAGVWKRK